MGPQRLPGCHRPPTPRPPRPPPAPVPSQVAAGLLAVKPFGLVQLSSVLQYSSEWEVSLTLRDGAEVDESQARPRGTPTPPPGQALACTRPSASSPAAGRR